MKNIVVKENYSQANQDLFVLSMLKEKRNGVYIEIGAGCWQGFSNTFILEDGYGWTGLSFEIMEHAAEQFNERRTNKCICGDATVLDYSAMFEEYNIPKQIDYLSLDIEPPEQTLSALKKLPMDEYRFSVITFEHELHYAGTHVRDESRKIFKEYGYELIASDVKHFGYPYEDWYVDPNVINNDTYSEFISTSVEYSDMFNGHRMYDQLGHRLEIKNDEI
tara:strand:- start:662 stop:1321 length:660 start_codon:yes stop_codon:yes gene_type:complete